jgi:hypothetical protein
MLQAQPDKFPAFEKDTAMKPPIDLEVKIDASWWINISTQRI